MKISSNISFHGNILTPNNIMLVENVRAHMKNIERNGVVVKNCICKIPEGQVSLTTLDKKYNIGTSVWDNNLIIKQSLNRPNQDARYFKISTRNNVEYSPDDDSDFRDVEQGSRLANVINKHLAKILPKFL